MLRGLSVQSFLVSVRVGFLVCWILGFLVSEFLGFLVSKSLADPQTNTIKRQHQAKTCKFKLPSERFTHPSFTHPSLSIVFNYSFLLAMLICVAAVSQHRNWNIHRQTIQYSCFWYPVLPRSVLIQRLSASPSPRGKSPPSIPRKFSNLIFAIQDLEIRNPQA